MEILPDDCLAHIFSLTSPRDVGQSSVISSTARSMANSDIIWEKFLPPNYHEILSRLVAPLIYSSKKDLFLSLSKPLPIDQGNKMFSIEKSTGKICYVLSARELSIAWGSSPLYWSWKPFQPSSRFAEVAELRTICWLEIRGSIDARMLSPRTIYGAYLIVKVADRAYGLDSLPSEVSVEVGNFKSRGSVYVRWPLKEKEARNCQRTISSTSRDGKWPCKREDEWLEIELGCFFNGGGGDNEVRMCLKEVKGVHLKAGLIVEGIEIRPVPLDQAFT
ncbi:F-box protein PP2-B15-like isoform X1 [Prosopis cineraria]|uniref:F-box protein PP2-B15-like isoform X1 n=1 Tax=Prosopis cineraria TaxID=364024 RepID=UPI00240F9FED|nr:F-box protein PP2-B15-like isoform X1 [Prosopis cineraria]